MEITMVAQLVPNPNKSHSSFAQNELQKLREYCLRLNQALEVERAKSSKLRQYIARLNGTRAQQPTPPTPAAPQHTDTALQSLVEDQTRLLEQLYSENQKQYSENQKQGLVLSDLEHKIQQLIVANDKLKARNIELRRKLRPAAEATAQAFEARAAQSEITVKTAAVTKLTAVAKPVVSAVHQNKIVPVEAERSDVQRRWFRFSFAKN